MTILITIKMEFSIFNFQFSKNIQYSNYQTSTLLILNIDYCLFF